MHCHRVNRVFAHNEVDPRPAHYVVARYIMGDQNGYMMWSKALGYATIASAVVLKLPQMLKIYTAGSVQGLAPTTFYCDVLICTCAAAYSHLQGFPFSTYGEELLILAQNVLLVLMLWKYADPPFGISHMILITTVWVGISLHLTSLDPTATIVTMLPLATIVGIPIARCPQVHANFTQGHTGQLSLITTAINLAGSLARIFTTLTELSDTPKLVGYIISTALNVALTAQILWYWSATKAATAKGRGEGKLKGN